MEKTLIKEQGMITFGDWSSFANAIKEADKRYFSLEDELLGFLNMDKDFYKNVIGYAIKGWRNSTSRSLFQTIGKNGLALPIEGDVMFKDHLEQTRFFLLLDESRIVGKMILGHAVDEEGEKIKVRGGNTALTYPKNEERRKSVEERVNKVLQAIYVYAYFHKKKEQHESMKFPKKLYRGIRIRDMYNIPALKEKLSELKYDPATRNEFEKKRMDIITTFIEENGFNAIAENDLVSFTASKSIAKYFANKEGFVIEVNSKDVELLTSELHDERLAGKDWVSNRSEREYIVRVSDSYIPITDMDIQDEGYLVATNNPMAVNYFHHNDKIAYYELNGVRIKAQFQWSTNTKGSIRYSNLDDQGWTYGSREFQSKYGFSPVITNKNIKEIQNFRIERK